MIADFCRSYRGVKFPSPIGELHFSICDWSLNEEGEISFRPLSGSYISQLWYVQCPCGAHIVSVPYRGATFLNGSWQSLSRNENAFPSPIGELHFSIMKWIKDGSIAWFPSPIGELHFSIAFRHLQQNSFPVSVPYRGATFLNTISATPCPVWDE